MATGNRIQGTSIALGVVIGFVLYAVTRHIFWILLGVVVGVSFVMMARRR
jgi:hypothetical protein